jgi:hypothetical protein
MKNMHQRLAFEMMIQIQRHSQHEHVVSNKELKRRLTLSMLIPQRNYPLKQRKILPPSQDNQKSR